MVRKFRLVGWSPIGIPGEGRREERAREAARNLLEQVAAVDSSGAQLDTESQFGTEEITPQQTGAPSEMEVVVGAVVMTGDEHEKSSAIAIGRALAEAAKLPQVAIFDSSGKAIPLPALTEEYKRNIINLGIAHPGKHDPKAFDDAMTKALRAFYDPEGSEKAD